MRKQYVIESTIDLTKPIGVGATKAKYGEETIGELFIDILPTTLEDRINDEKDNLELARFYNDVIVRFIDPPEHALLIRQAVINIKHRGIGLLQRMIKESLEACQRKGLDPLVAITPGAIDKGKYRGSRDMLVQIPGPDYVSEEALRHHYERIGFLSIPDAVEMIARPEYFNSAPAIPIRNAH